MYLPVTSFMLQIATSWTVSRASQEKGGCRSFSLPTLETQAKRLVPWNSGQQFNTHPTDKVRPERRPTVSLYWNELLGWKLKIQRSDQGLTLLPGKVFPKGSCHRDESSINHTLAQNNLCEFWCGMHLTCKNTPIVPDRNELMNRLEKEPKRISIAQARCKIYCPDRLRKPCKLRNRKQVVWKTTRRFLA